MESYSSTHRSESPLHHSPLCHTFGILSHVRVAECHKLLKIVSLSRHTLTHKNTKAVKSCSPGQLVRWLTNQSSPPLITIPKNRCTRRRKDFTNHEPGPSSSSSPKADDESSWLAPQNDDIPVGTRANGLVHTVCLCGVSGCARSCCARCDIKIVGCF